MTTRITKDHVRARVGTVNRMLGYDENSTEDGAIHLYGAYGSSAIRQYVGDSMGSSDLTGLTTLRECSMFLGGMMEAIRTIERRAEHAMECDDCANGIHSTKIKGETCACCGQTIIL